MGSRDCEIVVPPIDMSYVGETDQKSNHPALGNIKSPKIVSKAKKTHKLEVNEKVVKKDKKKVKSVPLSILSAITSLNIHSPGN